MSQLPKFKQISSTLIVWYNQQKRDLPWRETNDPYKIWISEIILQQTRVNQGLNYYLKFIDTFPTIKHFAESDEEEILKLWQGLGYYSRARNMHKAALQIITKHGGYFPSTYAEVIQLAGVGEYTAAAICSFAYNLPHAVLDGNVFRVISRLFGIETPIDSTAGKKEFTNIANQLLSEEYPAMHNQAIMEFGALQCTPGSPNCPACPLREDCVAFKGELIQNLPVKSRKTKVSHRYFNYFFVHDQENTLLIKRTAQDVWKNLYEFPLLESDHLLHDAELLPNQAIPIFANNEYQIRTLKKTKPMKHILSHRIIHAQFITIELDKLPEIPQEYIKVSFSEIDHYPVSRLTELFLESI